MCRAGDDMAVRVPVSRCGGAFAAPGSKGMESKIRDFLNEESKTKKYSQETARGMEPKAQKIKLRSI